MKSLLVSDGERIGLFTESRFRDIVLAEEDFHAPVRDWVVFDLVSADVGDFIFHALLLMNQHQVQRVVVTEHRAG